MTGVSERATAIHFSSLVFDAHCDTVLRVLDHGVDLGRRADPGRGEGGETCHIDIPRLREGGVGAQVFACYASPDHIETNRSATRVLRLLDAMDGQLARHPDGLELARTAADVERIHAAGRTAVVLAVEGGHAIEEDLGLLRICHRLGVRLMTLTWNNYVGWADGCGPEPVLPACGGLSEFGRAVIQEMERLGMVVDVSHLSEAGFWEVVRLIRKPFVASHSNAWDLCRHVRNLKRDQALALAEKGGVIGINYYTGFISPKAMQQREAVRQSEAYRRLQEQFSDDRQRRRREERALERAAVDPVHLSEMMDHIDYFRDLVGCNHIGLGSDYDGISAAPVEIDDTSKVPRITEALLARGYPEADIRKILGLNFLRVLRAVVGE